MIRKKIAEAFVDILGRTGKLKTALAKAKSMTSSAIGTMTKWAKRGGILIGTSLAAGIGYAMRAAMKQEEAESKLARALKATGNAVGFTTKQLKRYAAQLQEITTFGDESIISMMALLATFKEVKGDAFKRATKVILDMSDALGQDLKQGAIQVGKALNDPVVGASALRRVGVSLSQQQMELIKTLSKTGQVAKAQTIILDELESEFGGMSQRTETATGTLKQLWNVIGDTAERLGAKLLPVLKAKARAAKDWIKSNEQLIDQKLDIYLDKTIKGLKTFGRTILDFGRWIRDNIKLVRNLGVAILGLMVVTKVTAACWKLVAALNAMSASTALVISNIGLVGTALTGLAIGTYYLLTRSIDKTIDAAKRQIAVLNESIAAYDKLRESQKRLIELKKELNELDKGTPAYAAKRLEIVQAELEVEENRLRTYEKYTKSLRRRLKPLEEPKTKTVQHAFGAPREIPVRKTPEEKRQIEWFKKHIKSREERTEAIKRNIEVLKQEAEQLEKNISIEAQARKKTAKETETVRATREGLQNQLEAYSRMEGFEKEAAKVREQILKMEAEEYSKFLEGKLSADEIYESMKIKLSKEALEKEEGFFKKSTMEKLQYLESMFESMEGFEKQHAIVQKAIWKETAKDYAKTGLVSMEEAYAAIAAKQADRVKGMAVEKAQVALVGFESMWNQLAESLTKGNVEENQLIEQKKTNELLAIGNQATEKVVSEIHRIEGGYGP